MAAVFNGGYLMEGYSHLSQFISEIYASGTEFGLYLRLLGFIPSGLLIFWFSLFMAKCIAIETNQVLAKVGLIGFGVTYGLFTAFSSIFICDASCDGESLKQILHNVLGLLTYLTVPIFIMFVGKGLSKNHRTKSIAIKFTLLGYLSIVSVISFFIFYGSYYVGLIQRLTEALFLTNVLLCYLLINKTENQFFIDQP